MMKKDVRDKKDNPATSTSSGMDDPEKVKKSKGKEASYPGDTNNAAGKNNEEKKADDVGSKPVKDESLNTGYQEF